MIEQPSRNLKYNVYTVKISAKHKMQNKSIMMVIIICRIIILLEEWPKLSLQPIVVSLMMLLVETNLINYSLSYIVALFCVLWQVHIFIQK